MSNFFMLKTRGGPLRPFACGQRRLKLREPKENSLANCSSSRFFCNAVGLRSNRRKSLPMSRPDPFTAKTGRRWLKGLEKLRRWLTLRAVGRRDADALGLKSPGRTGSAQSSSLVRREGLGTPCPVRLRPQRFGRRFPRRLQVLLWIVFGYFAVVQSKRVEQIHHPLGDDQATRR
jgi:hypothetical protein